MKKLHRGEKGLTLIELLFLSAILGILAAVIVPNLITFLSTSELASANAEVANVESAALAYSADNDATFPDDSTDLVNGGYLSDDTVYATYTINTSFGKVAGVTKKAAADRIEWDGTKWIKAPWSNEPS